MLGIAWRCNMDALRYRLCFSVGSRCSSKKTLNKQSMAESQTIGLQFKTHSFQWSLAQKHGSICGLHRTYDQTWTMTPGDSKREKIKSKGDQKLHQKQAKGRQKEAKGNQKWAKGRQKETKRAPNFEKFNISRHKKGRSRTIWEKVGVARPRDHLFWINFHKKSMYESMWKSMPKKSRFLKNLWWGNEPAIW